MLPVTELMSVQGPNSKSCVADRDGQFLLLHGFQTLDPGERFLDLLGQHASIIAPSHPGFGRSQRPDGFETVYDLVHLYLDLLESLPYEKVPMQIRRTISSATGRRSTLSRRP
jgi:pimeloyl-ACP methyl ester carboxylesterase